MYAGAKWNDLACKSKRVFICQRLNPKYARAAAKAAKRAAARAYRAAAAARYWASRHKPRHDYRAKRAAHARRMKAIRTKKAAHARRMRALKAKRTAHARRMKALKAKNARRALFKRSKSLNFRGQKFTFFATAKSWHQ